MSSLDCSNLFQWTYLEAYGNQRNNYMTKADYSDIPKGNSLQIVTSLRNEHN